MLTTEIHEAAVEFGRSLNQAPAVSAYRAAQAALDANPDAQALMDELRYLQGTFIAAQQRGETPTPEAMGTLRMCQADVRANEVIMAHLRATNEVKAFLPLVATEVTRALGTDYGRLIAPTSC
jgi:cell fate (sporulation/competence/biofilm development) regulator YlbF (YheA/YmcA/DUF963 family)